MFQQGGALDFFIGGCWTPPCALRQLPRARMPETMPKRAAGVVNVAGVVYLGEQRGLALLGESDEAVLYLGERRGRALLGESNEAVLLLAHRQLDVAFQVRRAKHEFDVGDLLVVELCAAALRKRETPVSERTRRNLALHYHTANSDQIPLNDIMETPVRQVCCSYVARMHGHPVLMPERAHSRKIHTREI